MTAREDAKHLTPTEHTPGPWRTHDVKPDVWTRQVWTNEGQGSVMIATTRGMAKEANARLIASAPALLAVLEQVRDFWTGGDAPEELENAIHAAIAQARGSK